MGKLKGKRITVHPTDSVNYDYTNLETALAAASYGDVVEVHVPYSGGGVGEYTFQATTVAGFVVPDGVSLVSINIDIPPYLMPKTDNDITTTTVKLGNNSSIVNFVLKSRLSLVLAPPTGILVEAGDKASAYNCMFFGMFGSLVDNSGVLEFDGLMLGDYWIGNRTCIGTIISQPGATTKIRRLVMSQYYYPDVGSITFSGIGDEIRGAQIDCFNGFNPGNICSIVCQNATNPKFYNISIPDQTDFSSGIFGFYNSTDIVLDGISILQSNDAYGDYAATAFWFDETCSVREMTNLCIKVGGMIFHSSNTEFEVTYSDLYQPNYSGDDGSGIINRGIGCITSDPKFQSETPGSAVLNLLPLTSPAFRTGKNGYCMGAFTGYWWNKTQNTYHHFMWEAYCFLPVTTNGVFASIAKNDRIRWYSDRDEFIWGGIRGHAQGGNSIINASNQKAYSCNLYTNDGSGLSNHNIWFIGANNHIDGFIAWGGFTSYGAISFGDLVAATSFSNNRVDYCESWFHSEWGMKVTRHSTNTDCLNNRFVNCISAFNGSNFYAYSADLSNYVDGALIKDSIAHHGSRKDNSAFVNLGQNIQNNVIQGCTSLRTWYGVKGDESTNSGGTQNNKSVNTEIQTYGSVSAKSTPIGFATYNTSGGLAIPCTYCNADGTDQISFSPVSGKGVGSTQLEDVLVEDAYLSEVHLEVSYNPSISNPGWRSGDINAPASTETDIGKRNGVTPNIGYYQNIQPRQAMNKRGISFVQSLN